MGADNLVPDPLDHRVYVVVTVVVGLLVKIVRRNNDDLRSVFV